MQVMLRGELQYRQGAFQAAFGSLREAAAMEEDLPYDEPWGCLAILPSGDTLCSHLI